MTTPKPDVLLELADAYERHGMNRAIGELYGKPAAKLSDSQTEARDRASAAECFTIAAALRSQAKGQDDART